jgi:protein-tyrosine-phosphatase
MDFCPKCGGRLVPRRIRAEEDKPQYTEVWEYGIGWRSVEREGRHSFIMECGKCGYRRQAKAEELEPVIRAKPAPLPDIPLGSRRYYPGYMAPDEYFRDEMRQVDVVESITRKARIRRVLFVCSGNAHRSPLAEALLKKLRPDLEVDSAGTHVAIPVSEEVKRFLAKDSAEQYLKKTPEDLDNKQLIDYDLIVAMEPRHKDFVLSKCSECKDRIIVWNIEDPYFLSPKNGERIYEQIKERTKELANSL